jgi:hypothetical protein
MLAKELTGVVVVRKRYGDEVVIAHKGGVGARSLPSPIRFKQ